MTVNKWQDEEIWESSILVIEGTDLSQYLSHSSRHTQVPVPATIENSTLHPTYTEL